MVGNSTNFGPGIIANIINSIRLKKIFKYNFNIDMDDKYYNDFVEITSLFFLEGIDSVSKTINQKKERNR